MMRYETLISTHKQTCSVSLPPWLEDKTVHGVHSQEVKLKSRFVSEYVKISPEKGKCRKPMGHFQLFIVLLYDYEHSELKLQCVTF